MQKYYQKTREKYGHVIEFIRNTPLKKIEAVLMKSHGETKGMTRKEVRVVHTYTCTNNSYPQIAKKFNLESKGAVEDIVHDGWDRLLPFIPVEDGTSLQEEATDQQQEQNEAPKTPRYYIKHNFGILQICDDSNRTLVTVAPMVSTEIIIDGELTVSGFDKFN